MTTEIEIPYYSGFLPSTSIKWFQTALDIRILLYNTHTLKIPCGDGVIQQISDADNYNDRKKLK
jgi:hypothetical protein